jgi:23S rRNA pseudouridine955/2504/2580 synthase
VLVDAPVLKQNDGTVKISRLGKEAQTYFTTLQLYKRQTLVECRPITGRMHQIRIHLSRLNTSITGDETYGGKPFFLSSVKRGFKLEKLTEEQPLMKRMALHAFSVQFIDLHGHEIVAAAPYPRDFHALLKQLTQNLR